MGWHTQGSHASVHRRCWTHNGTCQKRVGLGESNNAKHSMSMQTLSLEELEVTTAVDAPEHDTMWEPLG